VFIFLCKPCTQTFKTNLLESKLSDKLFLFWICSYLAHPVQGNPCTQTFKTNLLESKLSDKLFLFWICSYLAHPVQGNPCTQTFKTNLLESKLSDKFLFKSLWGEQDSNLRRFPNGFTVRPRWPLEYLPAFFK
jgi:hypothetical protein